MMRSYSAISSPPIFSNYRPTPAVILCIEESPRIMRSVIWVLHSEAYKIVWAKSMEEGLQLSKLYQPKLILFDAKINCKLSPTFFQQLKIWCQKQADPPKILQLFDRDSKPSQQGCSLQLHSLLYNELPTWLSQNTMRQQSN